MKKYLVLALFATAALVGTAQAVTTQLGHYGLGEAGSVGPAEEPSFYAPLHDDVGTPNDINTWRTSGSVLAPTTVDTGLAAPGSTAALQIVNYSGSQNAAGGYYGGSAYGLTDNWAFDIWIRPDVTYGSLAFQTDNSLNGIQVWYKNDSTVCLARATSDWAGPNVNGGAYSLGVWQRITGIESNGTLYMYVDKELKGSVAVAANLNDLSIGMGWWPDGYGAGTQAAFDELRTFQFGSGDTHQEVAAVIFGVPEPSTFVALASGLLGLLAYAWRRRK